MEMKIFSDEFDTIEKFKAWQKERSQKAANIYVSSYERSLIGGQANLEKLRNIAFGSGFSLNKYKSTLEFANKVIAAFRDYQCESLDLILSDVSLNPLNLSISYIEEIDKRLPVFFNRRKEFVSNAIPTIEQYKIVIENAINKLNTNKPPAEQVTFEQLFKDKSDVGKILGYLDEYISDEGKWIYKPQVRCLVALCMVLEKKGYFLNTWTNPIKAQVLSLKFGVPCTPKSFQASERWKSEHLIELFNIIPTKIIS